MRKDRVGRVGDVAKIVLAAGRDRVAFEGLQFRPAKDTGVLVPYDDSTTLTIEELGGNLNCCKKDAKNASPQAGGGGSRRGRGHDDDDNGRDDGDDEPEDGPDFDPRRLSLAQIVSPRWRHHPAFDFARMSCHASWPLVRGLSKSPHVKELRWDTDDLPRIHRQYLAGCLILDGAFLDPIAGDWVISRYRKCMPCFIKYLETLRTSKITLPMEWSLFSQWR